MRLWRLKGSRLLDILGGDLSVLREKVFVGTVSVLRKFDKRARTLDSVPSSVTWEMLHGDGG